MSRDNLLKPVEIYVGIHRNLKRLSFETDFKMKRLASAILYEALRDMDFMKKIFEKLREDERYYELET